MLFILGIPEGDDVFLLISAEDQPLLVRVWHITLYRHELRCDYRIAGLVRLGVRINFLYQLSCISIAILHPIVYLRLFHVVEGKFILSRIIDVQRDGVAVGLRIVAALVVFIQLRAGLGIKRLECTGQCAAGGLVRNFNLTVCIFNGIADDIRQLLVGTPLGIEVQIPVHRHGEVERLLFVAIHIEPANKIILAILGILRRSRYCRTMRNRPSIQRFAAQSIFALERPNRVGHRHPLGIKHEVVRRHFNCVPINSGVIVTLRCCIPTRKQVGSTLQLRRVVRGKVIITQCRFV